MVDRSVWRSSSRGCGSSVAAAWSPFLWLHELANAVGGVAFSHGLWSSGWPAKTAACQFAVVTILVATPLRTQREGRGARIGPIAC